MGMFFSSHAELHSCRHRVRGESDLTKAMVLLGEYYEGKERQGSWGYK